MRYNNILWRPQDPENPHPKIREVATPFLRINAYGQSVCLSVCLFISFSLYACIPLVSPSAPTLYPYSPPTTMCALYPFL